MRGDITILVALWICFDYKKCMYIKHTTLILLSFFLVSCAIDPSRQNYDPDAEFAKLDSPEVPGVFTSLEHNALEALQEGENERALGLYKQLFDSKPDEMRYQLGLAESMRRVGKNRDAIFFYDKVIAKHPGHLDANEGKALALMADGDVTGASKLLSRIKDRAPDRWRTHNALGILFAVKNMPKEAVAYFNEALKYQPNNPAVLNNIGLTRAIQRQYRSAEQELKKAAKHAKGKQKQHVELNLALVYGISGDTEMAEQLAERYLSGTSLDNNLGLYSYLANDQEMAKSYLNMALSGSTTYYKRAWKNLDIISKKSKSDFVPTSQQKIYKIK